MARSINEYEHSPGASLDYGFDYSAGWLQDGELIVVSDWSATAGITLSNPQITDGKITSTFVSGGTLNSIYHITNTITTNATPPRVDSRVLVIYCKNR